jgi:hypothetical protein
MPSREGGKVDRLESLVFPHAAKSPPLFVLPRHGYHRLSANNGGIRCERQCWRWRRSARLGRLARSPLPGRRPFRRRGPIIPQLKRPPVADRARVAHGERRGSAAQVVAGALLAAAAIGGVPGVTSRIFSSLVSRCRAEGLIVATASASAGAHFRLRMTWENKMRMKLGAATGRTRR